MKAVLADILHVIKRYLILSTADRKLQISKKGSCSGKYLDLRRMKSGV
jgi:hypothetical protein